MFSAKIEDEDSQKYTLDVTASLSDKVFFLIFIYPF